MASPHPFVANADKTVNPRFEDRPGSHGHRAAVQAGHDGIMGAGNGNDMPRLHGGQRGSRTLRLDPNNPGRGLQASASDVRD